MLNTLVSPQSDVMPADPFATDIEVSTETGADLLPQACGTGDGCGSTCSSSCTSAV
ncbi:FxLD family lanthipeptide [Streptomyces sp. NPDC002734]|uniref:FxLD family lanthipeptide n=1 Tax=Streptomyces sp. NPDC002734 TaxID=3154426 RepID=UPI0033183D6C